MTSDSPTHFTSSTDKYSLIDLVFVSTMHFFSDFCTIPELSNSDHLGLMLTMRHRHVLQAPTSCRTVWRYNLANFELANDLLCDVDFDEILDFNDMQKSWIQFKAVFFHVMEQCIPKAVLPQK